jgi:glyoxylase-like metal-dependent hydrolase (beta-lactamase superfamily II)
MKETSYGLRPLFDPESSTWTYILADRDSGGAVIIDPVLEKVARDLALLKEMDLRLTHVLETHIHADHVTGAAALKDETGALIAYGAANDVSGADIFLQEGDGVAFGASRLKALSTPGHTDGCMSYYAGGAVFTGDTLLIRGCGRTDFQSGSAQNLFDSVRGKLFALPDETRVCPAHDYKGMVFSTIGEEKKFNPRLSLENSRERFEEIMHNLKLPRPAKMDVAVPANMRAGRAPEK